MGIIARLFETTPKYRKGNITKKMIHADKITYEWYDKYDECVFGNMFDVKETGRRMRPHYVRAPRKGVIIPWDQYDLKAKSWVDYAKGNVLAPLGIGVDLEKEEGVVCVPKYTHYCRKGLVTYDMTHRDKIERPKHEEDYSAIFEQMFHEDEAPKRRSIGDIWRSKIRKSEMKHKKFTDKSVIDMTKAA